MLEDKSQENVTIDNDNIVVPIESNNNEILARDRKATNIINNIERELQINNNNRRNKNHNDSNNDQNANNNFNQENNNNNNSINNNLTEENNNDNESSSDEEASFMSPVSIIDRVQLLSDIDDISIEDSMLDYIPPQESPDPENSQESEV